MAHLLVFNWISACENPRTANKVVPRHALFCFSYQLLIIYVGYVQRDAAGRWSRPALSLLLRCGSKSNGCSLHRSASFSLVLCAWELNLIDRHLNLAGARSHCRSSSATQRNRYSLKKKKKCNLCSCFSYYLGKEEKNKTASLATPDLQLSTLSQNNLKTTTLQPTQDWLNCVGQDGDAHFRSWWYRHMLCWRGVDWADQLGPHPKGGRECMCPIVRRDAGWDG